jgi:hypothetical protein
MIILKNDSCFVSINNLKTREKNEFHIKDLNSDNIELSRIKSIEKIEVLEGSNYIYDDKEFISYQLLIEYSYIHRGYNSDLTNNNAIRYNDILIQSDNIEELKAIKSKLLSIKKEYRENYNIFD